MYALPMVRGVDSDYSDSLLWHILWQIVHPRHFWPTMVVLVAIGLY